MTSLPIRRKSNEPYRFAPLPGNATVRLLTLVPGPRGSDIHIEMDDAALDTFPKYEALSYEWGLPGIVHVPKYHNVLSNSIWDLTATVQVQQQVYCRGKAVVITKNLHTILDHLRHRQRTRVLWIDGICINQEDMDERQEQVLLMRRIYEQAAKVLMWIGEATAGTGRVFDIVRRLAKDYDDREQPENPEEAESGNLGRILIDQDVMDDLKGDAWPDIADVFTRPYFGRVWVVQEIVMSTTAEVLCGAYKVTWVEMYKAMIVILVLGLVKDEDPHQLPPEAQVPDSGFVLQLKSAEKPATENRRLWGRMMSIGEVWNSKHRLVPGYERDRHTLATLADLFLGHDVTDPRDRVYGMLGMADPLSGYGRDNPIQPDYKKAVEEVYRDACQWSIRDSFSLSMLDLCDAPARNVLRTLPTWVPDLTSGIRRCRLNTDLSRRGPAISRPLSTFFGDQFRVSFDKGAGVFTTRGLILDTVSYAGLPCTRMIRHIIAMQAFQGFCLDPEPYATGGSRIEAVWRTLLTNYISTGSSLREVAEAPASFGGHFIANMAGNFRFQLGLPDRLTGSEPDINAVPERGNWSLRRMYPDDVAANISILALMAKRPFIRYLYDNANVGDSQVWEDEFGKRQYIAYGDEGRQFVVTEKTYMGLGPVCPPLQYHGDQFMLQKGSSVQKGDVVAVLAGSDKVWYLRQEGDGRAYRIVGHGYVYGVMEGRCFDNGSLPIMEDMDIR